jgi:hypothetical protein
MSEKLKPCPLCGSEAETWTDDHGERSVACSNKQCLLWDNAKALHTPAAKFSVTAWQSLPRVSDAVGDVVREVWVEHSSFHKPPKVFASMPSGDFVMAQGDGYGVSCVPVHGAPEKGECENLDWQAVAEDYAEQIIDLKRDGNAALARAEKAERDAKQFAENIRLLNDAKTHASEVHNANLANPPPPDSLPVCPRCRKAPRQRGNLYDCPHCGLGEPIGVPADVWLRYVAENTPCRVCGETIVFGTQPAQQHFCGNEGEWYTPTEWIDRNKPERTDGGGCRLCSGDPETIAKHGLAEFNRGYQTGYECGWQDYAEGNMCDPVLPPDTTSGKYAEIERAYIAAEKDAQRLAAEAPPGETLLVCSKCEVCDGQGPCGGKPAVDPQPYRPSEALRRARELCCEAEQYKHKPRVDRLTTAIECILDHLEALERCEHERGKQVIQNTAAIDRVVKLGAQVEKEIRRVAHRSAVAFCGECGTSHQAGQCRVSSKGR